MNTIKELIEDIRCGKMVILIDDEDRENEGDIIIAADFITPQVINFMATEARGLICLSLKEGQLNRLGIPLMVQDQSNSSPNKTAFTVSIEAARGVSTGISAADRSHTIRVAASPNAQASDVIMPGHIFPIRAQEGGVLKRAGHTEASIDLAVLAGLNPSAVICEIMNPDGTMARTEDLRRFAKEHDIKMGTIEDLIEYRIEHDTFVEKIAESDFPCAYSSDFKVHVFRNHLDGRDHLAITKGQIDSSSAVAVRVHSECVLGDVFSSSRTTSGDVLQSSLEVLAKEDSGVLVYLRSEDMGDRLLQRVRAYAEQDQGEAKPVVMSDKRDYGVGAQILRSLGVQQIRLMTNSLSKRVGLKGYGLEIVDTIPVGVGEDNLELSTQTIEKGTFDGNN